MKLEEEIKLKLSLRGFDVKTWLNNRGLIGATIDETILAVVKNMDSSSSIKESHGICMSCKNWRYTNNGTGECMKLNSYTDEGFYCKSFSEGSYSP